MMPAAVMLADFASQRGAPSGVRTAAEYMLKISDRIEERLPNIDNLHHALLMGCVSGSDPMTPAMFDTLCGFTVAELEAYCATRRALALGREVSLDEYIADETFWTMAGDERCRRWRAATIRWWREYDARRLGVSP